MTSKQNFFELKVIFAAAKHSLSDKEKVLDWCVLKELAFVDEIVDGVDADLEMMNLPEHQRLTPMAIYHESQERIHQLKEELLALFPIGLVLDITQIEGMAWSSSWHEEFKPWQTSKFLVTHPDASALSDQNMLIHITVVPGEAFGNGQHATTEACLCLLETLDFTENPATLDIGTGTGLLAIAAEKLGASVVQATEIDEEIIQEARTNAQNNKTKVQFTLTETLTPFANMSFDLVMANILVPVLYNLADDITRVLREDGTLLLSGFIAKEAEPLKNHFAQKGFVLNAEVDIRGWKALAFTKDSHQTTR